MDKLLVVDDDEALRRLIRVELSDTFEIIDSGVPEEALALALENKPDAILLDLRMPKYSGYELLQTFTAFSHTQKIPVIIVSGEGWRTNKRTLQATRGFLLFRETHRFRCVANLSYTTHESPPFYPSS